MQQKNKNPFMDKTKERFGFRKLGIGLASVLLGTSLYFIAPNTQTVKADTIPNDPAEIEQNANNITQSKAKTVKTANDTVSAPAAKTESNTAPTTKSTAAPVTKTKPVQTKAKLATFKSASKRKKIKTVKAKAKKKAPKTQTKSYKDIATAAPEQNNTNTIDQNNGNNSADSSETINSNAGSNTNSSQTSITSDPNTTNNSSNASDSKPTDITGNSNGTENNTGSNPDNDLTGNTSNPADITGSNSEGANTSSDSANKQDNKKSNKLQGKAGTPDNNGYIYYYYDTDKKELNIYGSTSSDGKTVKTKFLFYGLDKYKSEATKIVFNSKIALTTDPVWGSARSLFSNWSNVTEIKGLNNLDTNNVTDMGYMFYGCQSLKSLDLSNLDTSNVTDMSYMFSNCISLESLDLSNFSTSKVTNMNFMFNDCHLLKLLDLSNFNTSNVTDMNQMFSGCQSLKALDLSKLDTSNVTDMSSMFYNCSSLESLDLSNFNTSKVTDMHQIFFGCQSLTSLDLSNFNTSKITGMGGMFYGCKSLKSLDLSKFDTSNVTNMIAMFYNCNSLESLDLSNFNTSKVTSTGSMFYNCSLLEKLDLSKFDTSNVTDMNQMFFSCQSLTSLDLSNFNTSKVTDMSNMFYNCNSLESLDLLNFNTSKVTNMYQMFGYCQSLTSLDLSKFDTSKVTDMGSMFFYCISLKSLVVSNFNTSNVIDMSYMFSNCQALTSLDLSNFNTSKVIYMGMMFSYCSLRSLDLSNFDTSNLTYMSSMFAGCDSLTSLDISNFNTSKVTDTSNIFYDCVSLKRINLSDKFKFTDDMAFSVPGTWLNVGNGTTDNPQGSKHFTSDELMKNYDPAKDADTYVLNSATNIKSVTDTRQGKFGVSYVKTNTNIRLAPDEIHYFTIKRTNLVDADTGKVIAYGTYYIDPNQDIPTITPPDIAGYSHGTKSITKDDWINGYGDHGYLALSYFIYYDLLNGYTETKSDQRTGNFGVHFVESGTNNKKIAPDVVNSFNIYHIKTTDGSGKVVNTSPWIIDNSQTIPSVTIPDVDGYNTPFWHNNSSNSDDSKEGVVVKGDLLDNYDGNYPDFSLYLGYTKKDDTITRNVTENTTGTFKVSYVKRSDKSAQLAPDAPVRQFKLHRTSVINDTTGEVISQGKWQLDEDQDIPTIDVPVVNGYVAVWNKISKDSLINDYSGDSTDLHMYMLYDPIGKIIPVDKDGNVIAEAPQLAYENDPNHAAQVLANQKVPTIDGMTPQTPTITPKNGAQDTKVVYLSNNKTTIDFLDQDNKNQVISGTNAITGSYDINKEITKPSEINKIVQDLLAKNYVLVTDPFADKVTASDGDQALHYVFKHKVDTKYQEKITRNLIVHLLDDQGKQLQADYVEPHEIAHLGTKDLVTGQVTWNGWSDHVATNPYAVPIIKGYIVDLQNQDLIVGARNQVLVAIQYIDHDGDCEITATYHKLGNFVPVDTKGKQIDGLKPIQYANDQTNASQIAADQAMPQYEGYEVANIDDLSHIDPLKDTNVTYYKSNQTKINFLDQDNNKQAISGIDPITASAAIGKEISKPKTVDDVLAQLTKKGYVLVTDPFTQTVTASEGAQDVNYIFKHGTKADQDTVTHTRTIYFKDQNGKQLADTKVQSVSFTRTKTTDLVTGNVTYGTWDSTSKSYDAVSDSEMAIKGYKHTPQSIDSESVNANSKDEVITVTYNPISHKYEVIYSDQETGKVLATDSFTLNEGQTVAYTPSDKVKELLASGYYDANKAIPDKLTMPYDAPDQTTKVALAHQTSTVNPGDKNPVTGEPVSGLTKTVTRVIKYVGTEKPLADVVQSVTFTRTATVDAVTGAVTYGKWDKAQDTVKAVTTPKVAGYKPDKAEVASKTLTPDDTDTTETVTYNPIEHQITIIYQDLDDNKKVLAQDTLTGAEGKTVAYDKSTHLAELAKKHYTHDGKDDTLPDEIKVAYDSSDVTYYIGLRHATNSSVQQGDKNPVTGDTIDGLVKTVTRTIKYQDSNSKALTQGIDGAKVDEIVQSATFHRDATIDEVTGKVTYGTWKEVKATFAAVNAPDIYGYTVKAEQKQVPSQDVTGDSENTTTVLTYTQQTIKAKYHIVYRDLDDDKTLYTDNLEGNEGETITYDPSDKIQDFIKQGYTHDAKDDTLTGTEIKVPYHAKEQDFIIGLRHKQVAYHPGDKNPLTGKVDDSELVKTVTKTVKYQGAPVAVPDNIQTVKFSRDATVDMAKGTISYGKWNQDSQTFAEVETPSIKGYTPDKTKIPSQSVTPDDKDIVETVTYTKNPENKLVTHFIDQDNNNQEIAGIDSVHSSSKVGSVIAKPDSVADIVKQLLAKGYEIVKDPFDDKTIALNGEQNADYVFKHKTEKVTETVTRNETVHFVSATGEKLADDYVQTATFTHYGTKDLVTGKITDQGYGDKQQLKAVNAPVIKGYLANIAQVPSQALTGSSDLDYTVKYQKLGRIIPTDAQGKPISDKFNVTYENDPKDPTKIKSPQTLPTVAGYYTSNKTIVPVDPTKDTLVRYYLITHDEKPQYQPPIHHEETPTNPSEPTAPVNPTEQDPETPSKKPVKPEQPSTNTGKQGATKKPIALTGQTQSVTNNSNGELVKRDVTKQQAGILPQTGSLSETELAAMMAALGIALISLSTKPNPKKRK